MVVFILKISVLLCVRLKSYFNLYTSVQIVSWIALIFMRFILTTILVAMISQVSLSYRLFKLRNPSSAFSLNSARSLSTTIDTIQLGSSDLKVTKVCLGTMTWGQQNTEEEGVEQLEYAYRQGINFIDTAEIYPVPTKAETQGRTDRTIAKWLSTKDRSKIILASKVAGRGDHINWLPGRNGQFSKVSKEQIKISVDESLKRLKTDYIDVIQIHWPDRYVPLFGSPNYDIHKERENAVPFEEQLVAFDELISKGKVRYLGVSNETPYGVMKMNQISKELGLSTKIISLQNSYSLLVRSDIETNLVEVCSKLHENIGILAYSPLAGGILTNKYADPETTPKNARFSLFPGYMERYTKLKTKEVVQEYARIAKKYDFTPTELALIWSYTRPYIASTIIGATTIKQLKENIDAYKKIDRFVKNPEIYNEIQEVYRYHREPTKEV